MKKFLAVGITTALLATGLAVAGAALPASAHDNAVSASCETLSVSLTRFADEVHTPAVPGKDAVPGVEGVVGSPFIPEVPAVYKDVKVIDTPYAAAVTRWDTVIVTEAVPAVTHIEYEFKQHQTGKTRWERNPNWNAESNPNSKGWKKTGNTKTVEDKAAVPAVTKDVEVIVTPEVQEVSHIEQELVTAAIPAVDAVEAVEAVEAIPAVEPVAAVDEANTVIVTIDGEVVADETFGTEFIADFDLGDKTVAHTYSVKAVAWDDSRYNVDVTGVSEPCIDTTIPEVPEKPEVTVVTGAWIDEDVNCLTETVAQTRTITTTDSILVDNVWVAQTPVITTETGSRDKTDAEKKDCVVPPVVVPEKPVDVVTVETESRLECETNQIRTETYTSTYGSTLVDNVWVRDTTPVITSATTYKAAEKGDCEAVVVPPTDKPDVETPPVVEKPVVVTPPAVAAPKPSATPVALTADAALAETGVNIAGLGVLVALLMGIGVAMRVTARRSSVQ